MSWATYDSRRIRRFDEHEASDTRVSLRSQTTSNHAEGRDLAHDHSVQRSRTLSSSKVKSHITIAEFTPLLNALQSTELGKQSRALYQIYRIFTQGLFFPVSSLITDQYIVLR